MHGLARFGYVGAAGIVTSFVVMVVGVNALTLWDTDGPDGEPTVWAVVKFALMIAAVVGGPIAGFAVAADVNDRLERAGTTGAAATFAGAPIGVAVGAFIAVSVAGVLAVVAIATIMFHVMFLLFFAGILGYALS